VTGALLGLGPEDFRVMGLALAEFGAGQSNDQANERDREQARGLHDTLTRWGFIPAGQSR
jgi:hypothetical protein